MCILLKVSVQDLNQIVDSLLILMPQCIWTDGLCIGNTIQCPVIWNLCNRVQGCQKTVLFCAVGRRSAWGEGGKCLTAIRCSTGSFSVYDVRCNRQNRGTWFGIAIGMTTTNLIKESTQQPGCDLISSWIIISITWEISLDFKVFGNAFFITNDFYFCIFDGT